MFVPHQRQFHLPPGTDAARIGAAKLDSTAPFPGALLDEEKAEVDHCERWSASAFCVLSSNMSSLESNLARVNSSINTNMQDKIHDMSLLEIATLIVSG
jgi:hypothetical protein